MKNHLFVSFLLLLIFISCNNDTKIQNNEGNVRLQQEETAAPQRTNTYVVITSFATTDKQKYADNIAVQTDQLNVLWNQNIVENIYFDYKSSDFAPTVVFFVKAKTEAEARSVIDKTAFVKNSIGSYIIKAVGDIWLTTNSQTAVTRSSKPETFAVVWDFEKSIAELPADLMQKEFAAEQKLFAEGILENAYLSTANDGNKRSSSTYFINSSNENEAKDILNKLPLITEKLGQYKLYYVGSLIKGKK